ncbi:hypothetical protein HPATCC43504_00563 [Helicobacter pylori]|uniref:Uncharacterized protein n=1 Tax=Helicobacter pylori TaxID=210 RepID=A0AAD1DCG0_HELPX|nr:hypothetical protein HPATCC43504_00563 [Helicobacter pylori]
MAVSSINQFDSNLYGLLNAKSAPKEDLAPVGNTEKIEREKKTLQQKISPLTLTRGKLTAF